MHGITVNDLTPRNKADIKKMLNTYPDCVCLVAEYETEFDGAVTDMPDGRKISFVVDDGHKFYGSITRKGNVYRLE